MGGPDATEVQVDAPMHTRQHAPSRTEGTQEMTTATTPYELKHVDTPTGRMAYRETGDPDAPVALYVHGVIVNGHLWRHQLEALKRIRRNLAVDLLGHGESVAAAGQGVTFDDQAAALVGFLDALGIDRVDLVPNDSVVGIAQIFAVHHPTRLRSLVLTNGDVHDNWPPAEFAGFTDRVNAGELPQIIQRFDTDHDSYRSQDGLSGAYQHPDEVADADIDAYITPYIANPAQVRDLERFILAFDPAPTIRIEDRLKQLTVPTAIVWGTGDIFFDEQWSHWLAGTIAGTRSRTSLEGARLLFPEKRPEELNREILRLWGLER